MQAWVMAHCKGDHMLYSIDHTIESRFLPQDWPQTIHRSVQKGSEQRRRELKSGYVDGRRVISYRSDTGEGAPEGTRIWRQPRIADLEHGYFDILTLIYAIRTVVDDNLRAESIHLADKLRIWRLDLKRGKTSIQEVPAGRFRAVEVLLSSELVQQDPDDPKEEAFRGLFGLQGDVRFFADARTGVPLRIRGELPLGPFDADVDIRLATYEGTPAEFKPLD